MNTFIQTISILCVVFVTACNGSSSNAVRADNVDSVSIYINTGQTQCNDDGLTVEEATQYLVNEGIDVGNMQCGMITGIAFPTVCGADTGNIYIQTIPTTALAHAEALGFATLSSLEAEYGYEVIDCP